MPTNNLVHQEQGPVTGYDTNIHSHYYDLVTPDQARSSLFTTYFESYVNNYTSQAKADIEHTSNTVPLLRYDSGVSIYKSELKDELMANFVTYDSYRKGISICTPSRDGNAPHHFDKRLFMIHSSDFVEYRSQLLEEIASVDLKNNEEIENLCSRYYNICDNDIQEFDLYLKTQFLPQIFDRFREGHLGDLDVSLGLHDILRQVV